MTDAATESSEDATTGTRIAWGYGLATLTEDGQTLDTWYPQPALGEPPADAGPHAVPVGLSALEGTDPQRGVRTAVVRTVIDLDAPPSDAPDAYLRLHLLSHRLIRPHGGDLTGPPSEPPDPSLRLHLLWHRLIRRNGWDLPGICGVLANVGWPDRGPCAVNELGGTRLRLLVGRGGHRVQVFGVDKFPRMTD